MAYEVIILGHLHMPLYFLGTFTEYPHLQFLRSERTSLKDVTLADRQYHTIQSQTVRVEIRRDFYRSIAGSLRHSNENLS